MKTSRMKNQPYSENPPSTTMFVVHCPASTLWLFACIFGSVLVGGSKKGGGPFGSKPIYQAS